MNENIYCYRKWDIVFTSIKKIVKSVTTLHYKSVDRLVWATGDFPGWDQCLELPSLLGKVAFFGDSVDDRKHRSFKLRQWPNKHVAEELQVWEHRSTVNAVLLQSSQWHAYRKKHLDWQLHHLCTILPPCCKIKITYYYTRLTALCPGLPGWAGTRKVKSIWILLKQETVSGSSISWNICKSARRSRQITMPAPHHS